SEPPNVARISLAMRVFSSISSVGRTAEMSIVVSNWRTKSNAPTQLSAERRHDGVESTVAGDEPPAAGDCADAIDGSVRAAIVENAQQSFFIELLAQLRRKAYETGSWTVSRTAHRPMCAGVKRSRAIALRVTSMNSRR